MPVRIYPYYKFVSSHNIKENYEKSKMHLSYKKAVYIRFGFSHIYILLHRHLICIFIGNKL